MLDTFIDEIAYLVAVRSVSVCSGLHCCRWLQSGVSLSLQHRLSSSGFSALHHKRCLSFQALLHLEHHQR